jgi:adenylate kinase family enzyme
VKYQPDGTEVSHEDYKRTHQLILDSEEWIVDGFGSMDTLWSRLDAADTLIYVDLPLFIHFWWVTKRLLTGPFKPPEGWPERSSIFKGSMNSYRVLWLCHKQLTPKYREYVEQAQDAKQVYHLRSPQQISQFLKRIETKPD